jgi:predicted transcriptional regulator
MAGSKPSASATTIKVPAALKSRIAKIARKSGRTPHSFMLEAIERETARQERYEDFVREARAADLVIEETGVVYAAADVHGWLDRLRRDPAAVPPKPWRR